MFKIGFSNDKYVELQSEHIRERVEKFGGKLYLEFGGKLFDDYHASRVLPGFEPDSKIRMIKALSEDAEIVIAINAAFSSEFISLPTSFTIANIVHTITASSSHTSIPS